MYPAGMTLFQKRFGPGISLTTGDALHAVARITAPVSVIWAPTSTPLVAYLTTVEVPANTQGVITLPSPDQDGFIDGFGNTIRGWTYTVEIAWFDAAEIPRGRSTTTFTYLAGQLTPADLEDAIPLPATDGSRIAVNVTSPYDGGTAY